MACCLPVIRWQLGGFRDKGASLNKAGGKKKEENIPKVDNLRIALTLLFCPLLGGFCARAIIVC